MTWDATTYDSNFSFVTDYGTAVLALLAAQPGERVLDLGCGTGHQTSELTAEGVDAVGLDADPAMIARARAEHPGTPYLLGDAQALRPEGPLESPFDAVVSNAALHWMPDQTAVLAGVRRLLRPGGRLVAEQGGVGNTARTWSAITAACADVGLPEPTSPWVFPSPGEQAARLEAVGFRVRLAALIDRPTALSAGDTTASWCAMFGRDLLAPLDPATRADLLQQVDVHAAALGLQGAEGWWVDYVRLRFFAEAA